VAWPPLPGRLHERKRALRFLGGTRAYTLSTFAAFMLCSRFLMLVLRLSPAMILLLLSICCCGGDGLS
jgi:hypothetical protein